MKYKFNFPTHLNMISSVWTSLNKTALTTDSASSLDSSFAKNLLQLPVSITGTSVSASQTSLTTTGQH